MTPRRAVARDAAIILGIGLVYAIVQAQLPHHVFWSNDGGEKLMQVRALIANGPTDPAIPYDPLGIEPAGSFRFAPLLPNHARVQGERLVPIVPIYFPLISSLPYRVLGPAGLYLLPALFSLLTLAMMARMIGSSARGSTTALCLLTGGVASPIFFYSMTFWEHTMAMFLATAGLFLISVGRGSTPRSNARILAAGVAMAMGAWLRGEVYFVIGATVLGLLATRPYRRHAPWFIAGVAAGLVPFALTNEALYGAVFGPQVTDKVRDRLSRYAPGELLAERWLVIRYLYATWVTAPLWSTVFLATGVLPAVYFRRVGEWSVRQQALLVAWSVAIAVTLVLTLLHLASLREPIPASFSVVGLWPSLPILPFAIAARRGAARADPRRDDEELWSFLGIVAVAALVAFGLGLPSRGGLQWGPRYALALVPLLILLSVRGHRTLAERIERGALRRAFGICAMLLVALGACIQLFGIGLLAAKKAATAELIEKIDAGDPSVIVANTWWIPEDLADVYDRIPLYQSHGRGEMNALFDALIAAGQREVLLLSSEDVGPAVRGHPKLALRGIDRVAHERVHYFDVYLYRVDLIDRPDPSAD